METALEHQDVQTHVYQFLQFLVVIRAVSTVLHVVLVVSLLLTQKTLSLGTEKRSTKL